MKKVLLIAYHYPPVHVSSGLQRTLKFSQYLTDFSWKPSVLTVNPMAYEKQSDSQMGEVPKDIVVKRALAFDTARHLSLAGKYPSFLALPDRWVSWILAAVLSGWRLIRQNKIDVIFSTYPIATSHLIGLILKKLTGKSWVADFRDSMLDESYPVDKRLRKVHHWLERLTIKHCATAIFTTTGALKMYADRYPEYSAEKWAVIENAFDEENFKQAQALAQQPNELGAEITFIHSGVLYPSERDPTAFFDAVAELKASGVIKPNELNIVLRATGHDDLFQPMLISRDIDDIVFLEPSVPYVEALQEMLNSQGLMIFQAANCNHQIPAKIYEYLRAEKPIFALTDETGDTAGVLKRAGVGSIVPLDDKEKIKTGLLDFIQQVKEGKAKKADKAVWSKHSRYARTEQLATLLNELA